MVSLLIIFSASFGWHRKQMDAKWALLYADLPLDTPVWIRLPNIGVIPGADGSTARLLKGLCGLRQVPKL